jgi:cytolysin-activating lysine-acyltransferase
MPLAGVVGLMARSHRHRNWTVLDIERLILPPLALGQAVLVVASRQIVGFGSFAAMSEEAEHGFVSGTRKIAPGDWNAGDRLWIIDIIAPFGHGADVVAQGKALLRRHGHDGRKLRFRRTYRDGRVRFNEVTI